MPLFSNPLFFKNPRTEGTRYVKQNFVFGLGAGSNFQTLQFSLDEITGMSSAQGIMVDNTLNQSDVSILVADSGQKICVRAFSFYEGPLYSGVPQVSLACSTWDDSAAFATQTYTVPIILLNVPLEEKTSFPYNGSIGQVKRAVNAFGGAAVITVAGTYTSLFGPNPYRTGITITGNLQAGAGAGAAINFAWWNGSGTIVPFSTTTIFTAAGATTFFYERYQMHPEFPMPTAGLFYNAFGTGASGTIFANEESNQGTLQ